MKIVWSQPAPAPAFRAARNGWRNSCLYDRHRNRLDESLPELSFLLGESLPELSFLLGESLPELSFLLGAGTAGDSRVRTAALRTVRE
jgi:hypothetical protein